MEKIIITFSYAFLLVFIKEFSDYLISKAEKKTPVKFWQEILVALLVGFPLYEAFTFIFYFWLHRISNIDVVVHGLFIAIGYLVGKFIIDLIVCYVKKRGVKRNG